MKKKERLIEAIKLRQQSYTNAVVNDNEYMIKHYWRIMEGLHNKLIAPVVPKVDRKQHKRDYARRKSVEAKLLAKCYAIILKEDKGFVRETTKERAQALYDKKTHNVHK